jgi:amino acid permease
MVDAQDLADLVGEYEHLQTEPPVSSSPYYAFPGFRENHHDGLSRQISTREGQSLVERTLSAIQPGSVRGSIFTLASTALGAGILSIPFVFSSAGLALGVILLLLGAALAMFSMQLLIATANKMGITNYSELVKEVLGHNQGVVLEVIIVVYSFGACVGYLIVMGGTIDSVMAYFDITIPFFNTQNKLMVLVTVVVGFPLALTRKLGALRFASIFSVCAVVFLAIAIFANSLNCQERFNDPPACPKDAWVTHNFDNVKLFVLDWNLFQALTITFFAFTAHTNLFSVYDELQDRGVRRMGKVEARSILLELSLYLFFGVSAYLTFLSGTQGNILDNYNDSSTLFMVARVLLTISLIIALPMNINPARLNFEKVFFANSEFSLVRHVVETSVSMLLMLIVAIFIPKVQIVFTFMGGTCCVYFCFVLPIVMYLQVFDRKLIPGVRYLLIAVLVITVSVGLISTYQTIITTIHQGLN